jgi:26S proteasome regulatory subunit T3
MSDDIEMKNEINESTPQETNEPTEEEKYIKYKKLQKELELLEIQENYIKEETNNLKVQYARGKQE